MSEIVTRANYWGNQIQAQKEVTMVTAFWEGGGGNYL